jgi:pimeloyl-ACP methyl ester carboxylesterase
MTEDGEDWRQYPGEKVRWKLCGNITGHELECGSIDVPMDQFSDVRYRHKTFSIPLLRMRGNNATQNLLLNPGGPGAGGAGLIIAEGASLNTIVGENFHLLTFDPRGVNQSRPLASCYPDNESRRRLGHGRLTDPIRDSPNLYAWTTNLVQSCKENMGEYLKYINTPQTAADMNSILDAVGQEKLLYWGMSYGTILGQVYATMYPERSGRVIIDGVADQFQWFNELFTLDDFVDTDNVFMGFFDECIKAGEVCPLSKFGKSKHELHEKTQRFINNLHSTPIAVYVNSTMHGVLDDFALWYDGIFRELYSPINWPKLADRLAKLLDGNATDAFIAYGQGDLFTGKLNGESNQVVLLNDQQTGPKYWPQGRTALLEKLLPIYDKHFFSKGDQEIYYLKQQWNISKGHSYVPKKGVTTVHPLLILSTTYDPVCPLVSAKLARDSFNGSRIVEIKGYGHCSLAKPSLCAGKYIRDYLTTGALPEEDVQCEIDGEYFPDEDKDMKLYRVESHSTEDLDILVAQERLAAVLPIL